MFENEDFAKLPGHWVLARLGKRVLRPGGRELTDFIQTELHIGNHDDLVEFAPGIGATLRSRNGVFGSYHGVEQNPEALAALQKAFAHDSRVQFSQGNAEEPPLGDACASVVWGEAIMTMQNRSTKAAIVAQAYRLLRSGGRYAMHEIALNEDVDDEERHALYNDLAEQVKMPVRPLKVSEWKELLEQNGFRIRTAKTLPMHLLEPRRILADEGWSGMIRIFCNAIRQPAARARVLGMRRAFRKHAHSMVAVGLVCEKG